MTRGRWKLLNACAAFLTLGIWVWPLAAQPSEKEGLAVVDFEVKGALPVRDAGGIVSELFIAGIDDRKYKLYERLQVTRLLKEQALQASDLMDQPAKAVEFGKLSHIRYLLVGAISQLGDHIILTARLIDCQTGQTGERAVARATDINQLPDMVEECLVVMGLSRAKYREQRLKAIRIANRGHDLWEKGNQDGAIAAYREAIRLDPDFPEAHFNLAYALQQRGQNDLALSEYQTVIRLKPDHATAHNNLGVILRDKGNTEGAIAEWQEAIRLSSTYALPRRNLGRLLLQRGEVDAAIAELQRAVALDGASAESHYALGLALSKKEDWPGAIARLKEAVRLKPDNANSHFYLGYALKQHGDLDGAIAAYREAVRLKPDFAEAHNNIGVVLWKKGNLSWAIAAFQEAMRLKPSSPSPYYNLACVNAQQGQVSAALDFLRKAIALDSKYKEKAARDEDLAVLRNNPDFQGLVKDAR